MTVEDIQTRNFHIDNYKELKKNNNVHTFIATGQKSKINHIFNLYKKELYLSENDCPCQECRQKRSQDNNLNKSVTMTITSSCGGTRLSLNREDSASVNLIKIRYEIKRNNIKRELLKECTCCGEAW